VKGQLPAVERLYCKVAIGLSPRAGPDYIGWDDSLPLKNGLCLAINMKIDYIQRTLLERRLKNILAASNS